MSTETQSQQSLESIKAAQQRRFTDPRLGNLEKSTYSQSTSATSGLTFYDLEEGAKILYPVLTPLRNTIPRVPGKGGVQANWRAITAINTSGQRFGVSAAHRGGVLAVATQDYIAAYKGIGIETSADFEAQYAGQDFDDIRGIAGRTGLQALMLGEEALIIGGNASLPLGMTPTPSLSDQATGGSLDANMAYSVICVALTHDGISHATISGGVQGQIVRVNADGTSDAFGGGAAAPSTAAMLTMANDGNTTHAIKASVAPVAGALGYAWFWGAAGSEVLGAITTINSFVITAPATGTQTSASLGTSDNSINTLVFDGLITQAARPGSGAYIYTMATGSAGIGTALTADGAGGIVEIDAVLKYMWDNYRLSPDTMWVSSQEVLNISKKILDGSATAAQRFVFESNSNALGGGIMVRTYLNRFSMQGGTVIDIKIHPNIPAGTILMTTRSLPYPLSGVANVMQIRTRQDYYQIEWPLHSRRYEYGIYADEVLQHYFPPSLAMITNIGNG
jgi:hypothetical protein